jgi:AraC-like DNA-binding protein
MEQKLLKDLRAKFSQPKTVEEFNEIIEYLKQNGIVIGNLYQEFEMSSKNINMYKDVSYSKINISLHSHSFYEVIFCRKSDGVEYLVGSKTYRLIPGDLIVVPPGVGHRPILPDVMSTPYDRDVLWANVDFVNKIKRQFKNEITDRLNKPLLLRTKSTKWGYIGNYFSEGINETLKADVGSDEATAALSLLIFTHIFRVLSLEDNKGLEAEKPRLINSIIEYIEENVDKKITLESVAAHFYLSRGTVNNLFKSKMDTTFYKYLTQRRLILAKLLISRGESMESTAVRCGFSDYSVFFKAFKKEYNLSPREYAKL